MQEYQLQPRHSGRNSSGGGLGTLPPAADAT